MHWNETCPVVSTPSKAVTNRFATSAPRRKKEKRDRGVLGFENELHGGVDDADWLVNPLSHQGRVPECVLLAVHVITRQTAIVICQRRRLHIDSQSGNLL